MRTRAEIMEEINYQQRRLKSAVNCKDKQSVLERKNIINGLSWCLGTDFLTEDERKYVDNDTAQAEILMLQSQLERAEDVNKFQKTIINSYYSAYQDLKTRYEGLEKRTDKKYYDVDKLNTLKDQYFIILPRCNCKQFLNQLYGQNVLSATPYSTAKKQFIIPFKNTFITLTQGDVIKVQIESPRYIIETGVVKEASAKAVIIEDDGGRAVIITCNAIKRIYNFTERSNHQ